MVLYFWQKKRKRIHFKTSSGDDFQTGFSARGLISLPGAIVLWSLVHVLLDLHFYNITWGHFEVLTGHVFGFVTWNVAMNCVRLWMSHLVKQQSFLSYFFVFCFRRPNFSSLPWFIWIYRTRKYMIFIFSFIFSIFSQATYFYFSLHKVN